MRIKAAIALTCGLAFLNGGSLFSADDRRAEVKLYEILESCPPVLLTSISDTKGCGKIINAMYKINKCDLDAIRHAMVLYLADKPLVSSKANVADDSYDSPL
jgi:hypothetical protein